MEKDRSNNISLGDIFKIIRKDVFGLSLVDIGQLLDISDTKYYLIENNKLGTNFHKNIVTKLYTWSVNIIKIFDSKKPDILYLNDDIISSYKEKLYNTLMSTLKKSIYKSNLNNFKNIDIHKKDTLIKFLTTVFTIFSDSADDYIRVDGKNTFLHHAELSEAPFIAKLGIIPVSEKHPDIVLSRFDIRFTNPNELYMPISTMHTIEHCLAFKIREITDDLIDISIMGCRTGYLALFKGDKKIDWVVDIVFVALENTLNSSEVPGSTPELCWNYKEHDLSIAKVWVERMYRISKVDIINPDRIEYGFMIES